MESQGCLEARLFNEQPLHCRQYSPALLLFCGVYFDFSPCQVRFPAAVADRPAAADRRLPNAPAQEFARRGKLKVRQGQETAGLLSHPFFLGL